MKYVSKIIQEKFDERAHDGISVLELRFLRMSTNELKKLREGELCLIVSDTESDEYYDVIDYSEFDFKEEVKGINFRCRENNTIFVTYNKMSALLECELKILGQTMCDISSGIKFCGGKPLNRFPFILYYSLNWIRSDGSDMRPCTIADWLIRDADETVFSSEMDRIYYRFEILTCDVYSITQKGLSILAKARLLG